MADDITLRCPDCGRHLVVKREKHDPVEAAIVEVQCDRHPSGGFELVSYYRADGSEIMGPF